MLILARQRVRPAHDAEVGGTSRDQAWRLLAEMTALSYGIFWLAIGEDGSHNEVKGDL